MPPRHSKRGQNYEHRSVSRIGKRTAKVATVRSDGRSHVAPVWFVLDGGKLVFMTGKDSVKGKNILRTSRVMLSIDDKRPPFAFVLIEGEAVAERTLACGAVALVHPHRKAIHGSREPLGSPLLFRKRIVGNADSALGIHSALLRSRRQHYFVTALPTDEQHAVSRLYSGAGVDAKSAVKCIAVQVRRCAS